MEIPEKLKCSDFRFIKIIAGTKRPVDDDWNLPDSEYCYKFTDKEFQRYLKNAKAYGVICGMGNLAVIDADHEQVAKEVKFKLPKTFTVKSGSGKWHFYYKIPDLEGTIVLDDAETGTHFGEVQHLTKEKKTTQASSYMVVWWKRKAFCRRSKTIIKRNWHSFHYKTAIFNGNIWSVPLLDGSLQIPRTS
jgi:hypothetical protein